MKTVVVTGGSGGIGSQICKEFASNGYKVALIYNANKQNAQKLACDNIKIYQADVASESSVNTVLDKIKAEMGKISVLINCAGISVKGLFQCCAEEEFDKIFSVNVKGVFNCTKAVISDMLSLGYGDVINISSIWAHKPASCEVLYSATKGAVNSLTVSLAEELKFSDIKVNAISPGFVDTDMNKDLSQEEIEEFLTENGLKKVTTLQIAKKCLDIVNGKDSGIIYEMFGEV